MIQWFNKRPTDFQTDFLNNPVTSQWSTGFPNDLVTRQMSQRHSKWSSNFLNVAVKSLTNNDVSHDSVNVQHDLTTYFPHFTLTSHHPSFAADFPQQTGHQQLWVTSAAICRPLCRWATHPSLSPPCPSLHLDPHPGLRCITLSSNLRLLTPYGPSSKIRHVCVCVSFRGPMTGSSDDFIIPIIVAGWVQPCLLLYWKDLSFLSCCSRRS